MLCVLDRRRRVDAGGPASSRDRRPDGRAVHPRLAYPGPAGLTAWRDPGPAPGPYTYGRYIPVAVPGYENLTVAWNVNELGDVAGWYFPSGATSGQLVGYVEVGGRYTPVPDTTIPAGATSERRT